MKRIILISLIVVSSCFGLYRDGRVGYDKSDCFITVAASDSPVELKKSADYICDGTSDEVQIQSAIDSLPDSGNSPVGGTIYLLQGTYNMGTTDPAISIPATGRGIIIKGQGTAWAKGDGIDCGARIRAGANGQTVISHSGQFGKILNISIDTATYAGANSTDPTLLINSNSADQEIAWCSLTSSGNRHLEERQVGIKVNSKNTWIHNNWIEFINVGININTADNYIWINENIFSGNYFSDIYITGYNTGRIWIYNNKSEIYNGNNSVYFLYSKKIITELRATNNFIKELDNDVHSVYRFDDNLSYTVIFGDSFDNKSEKSNYIYNSAGTITECYNLYTTMLNSTNLTEVNEVSATGTWITTP